MHDAAAQWSILPLCLSQEPVGSLGDIWRPISEKAVQAIGNLAAIAMERSRVEARQAG